MKWAIDKIINNIVVIENIDTLEKREIDIILLPPSIHEGSILTLKDNNYILDETEEQKRRREIEERFKKLRNNC